MTTNERTVGRYLRWLLAALSLGAGVIHFAVSGEHYDVSWAHGTFFAVVASLAFTPALASSHHHDAGGTDTHTVTASGHDHGAAASGHQHGVTTLNGQQVKGVKAADVKAESQPDQPLDATTRATLKTQLTEARDFALSYPTVADVTAAQCAGVQGNLPKTTGYMVHAWVVPSWESPLGVFSHDNPNVRCADGTFHTDKAGFCAAT